MRFWGCAVIRNAKLLAGLAVIAIFGAGAHWLDPYLSIDTCLDGGGAWDYQRDCCQNQ